MASRSWRRSRLALAPAISPLSSLERHAEAQEPTEGLAAAAQNPVAARIGGGIGKIVRIGAQPINGGLQIFDYIKRPGSEPNWAVLFQAPLLFSC